MKPQVNINLNIEMKEFDPRNPDAIKIKTDDAVARAEYLIRQIDLGHSDTDTPTQKDKAPTTSRHYQAVQANTRISDAIAFVNKEIKLLKGQSENGTLRTLEEIKLILLGMN